MDKNGVIEFRCKKCGRHFWDYLIQNDDNLVVVQAVCMKCDRCKRTLVLKKYTEGYLISHSKKGVFKLPFLSFFFQSNFYIIIHFFNV